MKASKITFKRLKETDLPLMHKWFNTPHVSEWWEIDGDKTPSLETVRKHYLPRIKGNDPVDCFLIICGGTPVGMVQSCKLDDFPAEKANFDLDRNCAGIDIVIGEGNYVHRGMGSVIIKEFLHQILFKIYDVGRCIVDPYVKNEIAIKAYYKAGFKYLKTVWYEKEGKQEHLLYINRDENELDRDNVRAISGGQGR